MAELAPRERLQPALLDRLTDQDPASNVESRDRRVISLPQLKAAVLRDLVWLFNTACRNLQEFEGLREVERSVLNYGVPNLTGRTVSSLQTSELEVMLTEA